jgi:5-formyltetrahydrofolate cyclo-ligase
MGETKASIRTAALKRRDSLSATAREQKSRLIQSRAVEFPLYVDSPAVALYSATGSEVATDLIRDHALRAGKELFYPSLAPEGSLRWVRCRPGSDFVRGRYGILEPAGPDYRTSVDADGLVVFVPGVAFDVFGDRLGRGQGWYDRALASLVGANHTIGLAYETQLEEERIPTDLWDRRVEYLITEGRIVDCRDRPLTSGVPETLSVKRGG